jgi:hypothetical protein
MPWSALRESRNNMAAKKTKLQDLRDSLPKGITVNTYSPGDGLTRYRFFRNAPKNQTYFGPDNGIHTSLGFKQAAEFALGLASY